MAIEKTKLSGGGETGEITDKRRFSSRLKSLFSGKRGLILILLFVVIVAGGVALYIHNKNAKKQQTLSQERTYTLKITGTDNSDASRAKLVEEFGPKYDDAVAKVMASNPGNWDKAMVDNACAALLYADKIGAYTQVNTLLAFIGAAQKRGVNIDDNSYGVTQDMRDAIKKRADAYVQQNTKKLEGQN